MNFRTSPRKWFTGWLGLALCLAVSLVSTPAAGENKYWINDTEGGWWNIPTNWSPLFQPLNGDNVYLTQSDATSRMVYYYSYYPDAVLNNLWIDATGSGTMTLYQGVCDDPLNSRSEYVGYNGTGTHLQSLGANTVSDSLYLGVRAGSRGTYELRGGSLSAPSQIIGWLGIGSFTQSGGTNTVADTLTLSNISVSSGTMTLTGGSTTVQGEVTNSGTVKTTNANVTWTGTFTNSGAYISDPATQTFTDLIITSTGYLQGGLGDKWSLSGNFQNESTRNTLWKTALSDLAFTGGGTHQLYLPGADLGLAGYTNNFAWGSLDLTGQNLTLYDGNATTGGAQYLGEILGILFSGNLVTNITGNGLLNIYYNPNLPGNAYLGGLTYDLTGGGHLTPTPAPATYLLLATGLAALAAVGRKRLR